MAEIRSFPFLRHLRAEPTSHVLAFRRGRLVRAGRGLAFWFRPLITGVSELPADDREIDFLFRARSLDYQDVALQGAIAWRVEDAKLLAERVDFSIDLKSGAWLRQPLDKVAGLITQMAQQHAAEVVSRTAVREALRLGAGLLRETIASGLAGDGTLAEMGLSIVSVRVSSVAPAADLEKALEMPMRERIQQESDQAIYERRALAVEKERAIQEAELQNQIELAHREEQLIGQRGQNERRRVTDDAEAKRIAAQAEAERSAIEAQAKSESMRLVDRARTEAEQARMDIYRALPATVMLGLAARELAGKLQRIDHLNLGPDLFGPQLLALVEAGTKKLEAARTPER
jgi:regulator of protease activity HflC (stomatin/prohibitin superfamily)